MATQPPNRVVSNPSPRTNKIATKNQSSAQIEVVYFKKFTKKFIQISKKNYFFSMPQYTTRIVNDLINYINK